jgi:hypothetical protein
MSRLTVAALLGAAGISFIALNDAVTLALTGTNTSAGDDTLGLTAYGVIAWLVHAAAYLSFAAVLQSRRHAVDGGSRVRRWTGLVLTTSLVVLAIGMVVGTVLSLVRGDVWTAPSYELVMGTAFFAMFVTSLVLGFSLLRRPGLRLAGWTLAAVLPAMGVVFLLGALGSPWAHPAYVEALSAFGLAFVGLAPRREAASMLVNDVLPADGDGRSIPVGEAT